jgi:prepilin-type processing-associated H-X9-DG protein
MRILRQHCRDRSASTIAFTRIDLMITILVATAMGLLLLGFVLRFRSHMATTTCAGQLQYFYLCSSDYASDHGNRFPWEVPNTKGGTLQSAEDGANAFIHFQVLSNRLLVTPSTLCPKDSREPAMTWRAMANKNVSYFVGIDSKPSLPLSIIAGDRNVSPASGIILKWFPSAPPQWVSSIGLHGDRGNILFGDGRVEGLNSCALSNALQRVGMATNRFAVP